MGRQAHQIIDGLIFMSDGLFETLGFKWDRSLLPAIGKTNSLSRVTFRFQKMMPEFVWDAIVIEGNPFSYPEVKTLMDGITVGGRKISDQEQVLNLAAAAKELLNLVRSSKFALSKDVFTKINSLFARNESLEWGVFRGEGEEVHYTPNVFLGEMGSHTPLPTMTGAPDLNNLFDRAVKAMNDEIQSPMEKGLVFFLFGALQQFFFDGNKRTSRFMMSGVLMSCGLDAISVPASRAQEFNEKMVRFYVTKDATEMIDMLMSCYPDIDSFVATDAISFKG